VSPTILRKPNFLNEIDDTKRYEQATGNMLEAQALAKKMASA
jgi:hypothetical protein